jgi:hypothetical protein
MEDIEFRLKRGSELERFDQFWDDGILFHCRYSRLKWLQVEQSVSSAPPEMYSHALKGNKGIHISYPPGFDVTRFSICDLPWVTSISSSERFGPPAIHDGPLYIKYTNYLVPFARGIRPKLDPSSTYIFTDARWTDVNLAHGELGNDARVLISFVAPTSGQSLILRLKHSGKDGPLEVALGSTKIQLNPSSESSLTIDDITLHPTPGPSESDHLSFKPGRNDIFVKLGFGFGNLNRHYLHDIELLDEASLKDPRNHIINAD